MPLDTVTLKADINTMMQQLLSFDGSAGNTPADAVEKFKNDMAAAIEKFVKTGTVTVTSVSGVTTGAGVSGPGTGTIS